MEENNLIELIDLKKDYTTANIKVHALRGISLKIRKGEFVAMAGPSGSGKSTLLNLIGALDQPSFGQVKIEGKDISKFSKSEQSSLRRNKIGFIFQNYNLIPVLTALENTEYVLMLQGISYKERIKIAKETLRKVGLQDKENSLPHQLSGGQQQRVAIARAIAPAPDLILADEPTANLDSKTSTELLNIMEKLHSEKNITFLFSTHDKSVMEKSKRLLWMKDGQITYDGDPKNFTF